MEIKDSKKRIFGHVDEQMAKNMVEIQEGCVDFQGI